MNSLDSNLGEVNSQLNREREEIMRRNKEKKWLPCLGIGCDEVMYTTIGERFCRKCSKDNERCYQPKVYAVRIELGKNNPERDY